jgi:phosphate transport system substrate-binding protein
VKLNGRLSGVAFVTALLVAACGGGGGGATTAPSRAPGTATTPTHAAATPTHAPASPTQAAATQTTGAASHTPGASMGVPSGISGNVDIHGSSTVYPISNAVAEDLRDSGTNPEFTYTVGDEGTGVGFAEFFCVGSSDISDASRKIRADDPTKEGDEEATVCANNGVDFAELKVGFDGIAVITSINNDAVDCLTFADLYALLGPDSDDVDNWNDAETLAHDLGSTTDLPDAPLSITAPGDESGTYDSFIELALAANIALKHPDDPATTVNETSAATHLRTPGDIYVASANDNAIIQGVAGFDTSLGFVGLAYAEENADQVKLIGIDKAGDGTCITPSTETVQNATYPLSRSLYIYPNLDKAAENDAIVQYVDYYLSDAGISNVAEVGYVALHEDDLAATRAAWEAAKP